MLDHRASDVPASPRAQARSQAGWLNSGLDVRSRGRDDTRFGDVLTDALADNRPVRANRPDRSDASVEDSGSQETSVQKRPKREEADDDAAHEEARARRDYARSADGEAAMVPAALPVDSTEQPQLPDVRPAATVQKGPADATTVSVDATVTVQPDTAAMAEASQQAAAAALQESNNDISKAPATTSKQNSTVADKPVDPLASLEWLARQQAARLGPQSAAAQATVAAGASAITDASMKTAGEVDGDAARSAVTEGTFTTALSKEGSARHGATQTASTAAKVTTEEVVRSLTADAHSLLTDLDKMIQPAAPQTSHTATASQGSAASTTIGNAVSATLAPQVVDVQPAVVPTPVAASGAKIAAAKDVVMTFDSGKTVDNADRLAKVVYAAASRDRSVARMNLRPPELGDVTATIRVSQGKMQLNLEVASQAARDSVASGLDRLRQNLQHQGISLDTTTITIAPKAEPSAPKDQQQGWQQPDGQQQSAQQDAHGGHSQPQQDSSRFYTPEFTFVTPAVAVAGETVGTASGVSYTIGLNVVA